VNMRMGRQPSDYATMYSVSVERHRISPFKRFSASAKKSVFGYHRSPLFSFAHLLYTTQQHTLTILRGSWELAMAARAAGCQRQTHRSLWSIRQLLLLRLLREFYLDRPREFAEQ